MRVEHRARDDLCLQDGDAVEPGDDRITVRRGPKPRLDVVIRNSINEGLVPGPRYLAASPEITVAGSLGDDTLPHLPFEEFSFGKVVSGPEEMRKAVRMFLKYGVDTIKLNL